jgi:hypothetical protein
VLKKEKRAEMLYLYFNHSAFKNLHWKGSAEGSETILGGLDRSSEKQTG